MELKETCENMQKLLEMAREINAYDGSEDWADTFGIEDADDYMTLTPSEILRAIFFGDIEDGVGYSDAQIRFNAYANIEIVSNYTLEKEAWGYKDDILEDYESAFGEDMLNEALSEMDTDGE